MQVRNFDQSILTIAQSTIVRKFIATHFGMDKRNPDAWALICHADMPVFLAYVPMSSVPMKTLDIIIKGCR